MKIGKSSEEVHRLLWHFTLSGVLLLWLLCQSTNWDIFVLVHWYCILIKRNNDQVLHSECREFPKEICSFKSLHITSDVHSVLTKDIGLCNKQMAETVLIKTLRTGDADLRFYITTVQEGCRKSAFLTRACFSCTIHLIMQYIEHVSEWSCWRMFIETWPHSELTFRHRASSI